MSKFVLAAVAAVALAGPAFAAPSDGGPKQVLTMSGVNFSDPAAVRAFYGKVYGAATALCDADSNVPRFAQTDLTCVRRAMAEAVRVAHKPALTAMLNADQGGESSAFAGR